jgi:hypothetical protein
MSLPWWLIALTDLDIALWTLVAIIAVSIIVRSLWCVWSVWVQSL